MNVALRSMNIDKRLNNTDWLSLSPIVSIIPLMVLSTTLRSVILLK